MTRAPLELWVGAECTINRLGNRWRDQAQLTGFRHRDDDLERLAALGARRVRLPVLWEHVEPEQDQFDFTWTDRSLARLRELGVAAIVGLLHHGSGPARTHLLDERFPQLFAEYAGRIARRYPDQKAWTPINEPLTTARFSCLYGVWYPHRADDRSFVRALLNQMRATVLAMQAIRAVVPDAELVQTDDLGYTRCTPGLADQAAFDNERRWLAFDLLAGRVDAAHPLWDWLVDCGADESELQQFVDEPCPPAVVGINAYVTSERFLDERVELHSPHLHGGNGRQVYADVETVRAHGALIDGFAGRLREAHARYGLPLAITEVHLGCTREEQMRWLHQAWTSALDARQDGVDVRAVTAWAAFGTVDWNSLLTREAGHYEPGLWDVRSTPPRLTALGRLATALAHGDAAQARSFPPVLASPGWWQRDLRLTVAAPGPVMALPISGALLLVIGTTPLARAVVRLCHMRGLRCELLPAERPGIDVALAAAAMIGSKSPWAVIDATGEMTGDSAADDGCPVRGIAQSRALLAATCHAAGVRLLFFSYSPAEEEAACSQHTQPLIVRTSLLFGPWDARDFLARGLALLAADCEWRVPSGPVVAPTYLPDLVQASLDLLIDGESGIWLLTNRTLLQPLEFARLAAQQAGADVSLIRAVHSLPSITPVDALSGQGTGLLPSLDDALERYQRDSELKPLPMQRMRASP